MEDSSRKIPDKCVRCAALSAAQAKVLHGSTCWDSKVCPSRRSYARHRDRRNLDRSRKRSATLTTLTVESPVSITYGILIVYRTTGDSPVHGIAAEIWQDQDKIAQIAPIHCCQMVPSQVHSYIQKLLEMLKQTYGIQKFASLVRLDPSLCPIEGCFLRSKVH